MIRALRSTLVDPLRRTALAAWRGLVGSPIVLAADWTAHFPELGEARWRRGGLPPRVGGWCLGRRTVAGIAVGRTIFLSPRARLSPAFLLHEVAHVRQFGAERWFVVRYVWESLRRGYRGNRFEREADAFAAQVLVARRAARSSYASHAVPPDGAVRGS